MIFVTLNILGFCVFADVLFCINYIVIQVIVLDFMLVTMIITEFFVLAARNLAEMKKYSERAGLVSFGMMLVCCFLFMKANGIGLKDLTAQTLDEKFSEGFDIFGKLTGDMLLWLIPLTLALIAIHFVVIRYRFRNAYIMAAAVKKGTVQNAQETAVLSRPHSEPVGFLYKEIKQNRAAIIGVVLLPLGLMLFAVLIVAAAFAFNRENFEVNYQEVITGKLMTFITIAIGYFIASGVLISIFTGDDKKLWAYFTVATPTGVKGFLYYKYMLCFAMNGMYMVAWFFTNSIMNPCDNL